MEQDKIDNKLEEMTVYQGMVELKLLDKKIETAIEDLEVIDVVFNKESVESSEKAIQSSYDRCKDLMDRKVKLKSAIMVSNATTDVIIGGENMTVAEAIKKRELLDLEKMILANMVQDFNEAKDIYETALTSAKENAQRNALEELNKDENGKSNKSSVELAEEYFEKYKPYLVNPLKIENIIDKSRKKLETFEIEVDNVLNVSNATTIIRL